MEWKFAEAIQVGEPTELVEIQRGITGEPPAIPSSKVPRGLAIRSLHVTRSWDGLWRLLGRRRRIYFLSVAFDLSGDPPLILPPPELSSDAVHNVRSGEVIQFSLGDGAPIFFPRVIAGGLAIYVTVCEADKGIRHVGEVLAQIYEDLAKDGSVKRIITDFASNPGRAITEVIAGAATAALGPISTILTMNQDDHLALFEGYFPAKGPWVGKLTSSRNGTTIEFGELG